MTKATVRAVVNTKGAHSESTEVSILYNNTRFIDTAEGEISVTTRPTCTLDTDNSVGGSVKGKALFSFDGYDKLHVVGKTYYYDGGSSVMSGGNDVPTTSGNTTTVVTNGKKGAETLAIFNSGDRDSAQEGNAYTITDSTSAPTRITDANMPGNNGDVLVSGAVSIDGFTFVCDDDGKIYNSSLDDVTTWNALNFIKAERVQDVAIHIDVHREHVVYFGTESIEFFYNAANTTGSPLSRRQDIYHNVGLLDPDSIINIGDKTYFIGRPVNGSIGVYKLENFRLTKVSNQVIDKFLNTTDSGLFSGTSILSEDGSVQILFNFGVNSTFGDYSTVNKATYVYDEKTTLWSHWFAGGTYSPALTALDNWTQVGTLPITKRNKNIVMFEQGTLATLDFSGSLDDLGLTAAKAFYYTKPVDMNTNERKKVTSTRVLHYPIANSSDTGGTINLSWLDTEATVAGGITDANFPTGRTINIDSMTARTYRCGIMRQRVFKVTLNANRIVKGLELDYTQLRG